MGPNVFHQQQNFLVDLAKKFFTELATLQMEGVTWVYMEQEFRGDM
jgi:hypothetical protein